MTFYYDLKKTYIDNIYNMLKKRCAMMLSFNVDKT